MNKLIVLAVFSLLLSTQETFAQPGKPLFTAPFGVQAFTFRKSFPIDISKTLDTIKMMGFTEIESNAHGLPPEQFRKLCSDRGITIVSAESGFDQLDKSADSAAHVAKLLGAKFVMCAWVPHHGAFAIADAMKAVDVFNRAGKTFLDSGLTLIYHAHGYEFQPYQTGTLLDYIISKTDPAFVSFEMDIFWIQFGGGDPVTLLRKYGSRWKTMHLKDMRKGTEKNLTGGTSVDNDVTLGTGEINIPAILKQAKETGIKHYFIEDESNFVNQHVPMSIAYLKGLTE